MTLELGGKSPCILGEDVVMSTRSRASSMAAFKCLPNVHRSGLRHAAGSTPSTNCRTGDVERAKILSDAVVTPIRSSIVNERITGASLNTWPKPVERRRVIEINPAQETPDAEQRNPRRSS